ncbi:MAG TPA: SIMPL domain-containing protein, partial [Candidatus Omnitrophota bacterium]|nr:SIMPL domain-containing protein [Candidatus Omnitrophota bacterium]
MKDVFTDENVRKVVVPLAITGILALTFVAGIRILSNTALQIKNKGYVNVKGFAKKEIRADLAVLQATIVSEDIELKNCYAKLDLDKEKVKTHLKKHYGLTDKEMMFEPASIEEIYKINERGYNTDQFVKYVLKQNVRLELKDVEKVEKIAAGIVNILNEGVKILINNPQYLYTRMDDLKIEMIGKATDN